MRGPERKPRRSGEPERRGALFVTPLHSASPPLRGYLFALVIALVVSGCTKAEPAATDSAIPPGTISGTVSDIALLPLAGATVTVDGANVTATTDATGAFSFTLLPGEYVVLASHPEFRNGALRASVLSGQTSTLAFTLDGIPKLVPYLDVQEGQGYVACTALVVQGQERRMSPCGQNDPNDHPTVNFDLQGTQGLEGIVIELVWEPRTSAAGTLHADVFGRDGEDLISLGASEGVSPLRIKIPGRIVSTSSLQVTVSPAGGMTDEEAGIDAGAVVQQSFTVFASMFYHAAPPGDYSALQSSS